MNKGRNAIKARQLKYHNAYVLCMHDKLLQSCPTLCDPMLLCPWDSPGKNTGVGCHALLQGIFLTQGSNLSLMSPALAAGFFTTSATWEAQS